MEAGEFEVKGALEALEISRGSDLPQIIAFLHCIQMQVAALRASSNIFVPGLVYHHKIDSKEGENT